MKTKFLALFLTAIIFFNTSYPVLSESLEDIENTMESINNKLEDYSEKLKSIELSPASSKAAYKYSAESDFKILLMAYKNANLLSYKLIELIKKDNRFKNEKSFIFLTEKSGIADKLLYDKSVKYLDDSIKKVKKLNDNLEKLISKKEERIKALNNKIEVLINKCNDKENNCANKTDPVTVSLTGLTGIVSLVTLANEIANAFKPEINSTSVNIVLDNNVLNSIFYNNFEKNGINLQKVDDYLLNNNESLIYNKLIDVITELEQAEMNIAVLNTSKENDFKEEAQKAGAIIKLLSPSISKLTENISKLVNYELSKNPVTSVIYVKFIHNVANIKVKQYKYIIANLFKSDKLIRNTLTCMNYEVKVFNSVKKDTIWCLESGQTKLKHDNKMNLDKNKSYIFRYNPIKKLPSNYIDHI